MVRCTGCEPTIAKTCFISLELWLCMRIHLKITQHYLTKEKHKHIPKKKRRHTRESTLVQTTTRNKQTLLDKTRNEEVLLFSLTLTPKQTTTQKVLVHTENVKPLQNMQTIKNKRLNKKRKWLSRAQNQMRLRFWTMDAFLLEREALEISQTFS